MKKAIFKKTMFTEVTDKNTGELIGSFTYEFYTDDLDEDRVDLRRAELEERGYLHKGYHFNTREWNIIELHEELARLEKMFNGKEESTNAGLCVHAMF